MGIKQAIDIDSKQKKELLTLFNTYLPNTKIWAYGSRVKWSEKPSSDLDLVAFSQSAQTSAVSKLKDALVESNLPFKVDLLIWDNIPNSFQVNIKENYFELQSDKQEGLPSGWRVVKLGKICEKVITGGTPLSSNKDFYKNGRIPWLNTKEVNFCRIYFTRKNITQLGLDQSSAKHIPKNCVIVAMYGATAGKVAINKIPLTTNQACCNLLINCKEASYGFIYYYLSLNYKELLNLANGAAQQNLNTGLIKHFKVGLPPLPEQKAIAHILGKLDDKIELNRQINQTLETTAQTLFKSWFVNFDPVIDNAIKAGNPIPDPLKPQAQKRKTTKSTLPKTTQDLFPNSFVFNHKLKKWIPEGWKACLSGEKIDIRDGTHDSPKKSIDGYPLVTSKHITTGNLQLQNTYLISEKDFNEINKRSRVDSGDILLTMIGTVGVPCLILEKDINFAIKNIGLFKTSKSKHLINYFYNLLKSKGMQNYLDSRIAGTTQKYLSLKELRGALFLYPNLLILEQFDKLVSGNNLLLVKNHTENITLTKLRDTLLPKLISGKIRVLN